jgi:hypothetical protein
MRTIFATIAIALAAGCIHSRSDSICAEYRGQFCVAGQSCSFNKLRDCMVCQCSPVAATTGVKAPPADESTLHP